MSNDPIQELRWMNVQGFADADEHVNGRFSFAAFDVIDVFARQAGFPSKLFLGETRCKPSFAQFVC
jgi:hypothetical protein